MHLYPASVILILAFLSYIMYNKMDNLMCRIVNRCTTRTLDWQPRNCNAERYRILSGEVERDNLLKQVESMNIKVEYIGKATILL